MRAIAVVVALAMVHVALPFDANIAALAVLAGSLALFFTGAGTWPAGAWRRRKLNRRRGGATAPRAAA